MTFWIYVTGEEASRKEEQEAHQLVGRQNAAALEFNPKPSESAFPTVFRCNFRPEVDSDVISAVAVDYISVYIYI